MKKGLRAKLFAFALALCLCTTMVTPAFAASGRYNSSGNRWSFSNWWNNRWNHDDDNTSDSNKSDSSETKLSWWRIRAQSQKERSCVLQPMK